MAGSKQWRPNIFGGQTPNTGIGSSTFSTAGAAVSDLFSGIGDLTQAQGAAAEAQNYQLAEQYALQEEQAAKMSTAIQVAQQNRELSMSLGRTTSQVAGAGFAASGSALDILRSSAAQGSIAKAVTNYQGQITQAGYQEQAQSYANMASAAQKAESGDTISAIGSFVGGGLQIAAAMGNDRFVSDTASC